MIPVSQVRAAGAAAGLAPDAALLAFGVGTAVAALGGAAGKIAPRSGGADGGSSTDAMNTLIVQRYLLRRLHTAAQAARGRHRDATRTKG
jgi:hypothetical protein